MRSYWASDYDSPRESEDVNCEDDDWAIMGVGGYDGQEEGGIFVYAGDFGGRGVLQVGDE